MANNSNKSYYITNNNTYTYTPPQKEKTKIDVRFEKLQQKNKQRAINRDNFSSVGSVIKIVFLFIILAYVLSLVRGNAHLPTFTSLLEYLSTSFETIPTVPFTNFNLTNMSPWVVDLGVLGTLSFTWLQYPFIVIMRIVDVLIFLINGIISVINFIITLFSWLF